jgi:hypothetical protein
MITDQTLQLAALGWMHRHQQQFQGRDPLLCSAAVQFLMSANEISQVTAENAVIHAYGELRHQDCEWHLDISLSSGSVAVIRDPKTHALLLLPVALIVAKLLPRPIQPQPRLHLVDTTASH